MKRSEGLKKVSPEIVKAICKELQEYTRIQKQWEGKEITGLTARQRENAVQAQQTFNKKMVNVLEFLAVLELFPIWDKSKGWIIPTDEEVDWWEIKRDEILCGEDEVDRYDSI